jgi:UDP:flavonoid glycosyltransferase YjiC (YdhE family)
MLDLFARGVLDAVLCHGGLNTVSEALAHGLPVVAAPIRHDQPITAGRVAAAGAGVRIDFADAGPDEIAKAVISVLDDPGYRLAAGRIAERFNRDGGVPAAVARLEAVVAGIRSSTPQPIRLRQGDLA